MDRKRSFISQLEMAFMKDFTSSAKLCARVEKIHRDFEPLELRSHFIISFHGHSRGGGGGGVEAESD